MQRGSRVSGHQTSFTSLYIFFTEWLIFSRTATTSLFRFTIFFFFAKTEKFCCASARMRLSKTKTVLQHWQTLSLHNLFRYQYLWSSLEIKKLWKSIILICTWKNKSAHLTVQLSPSFSPWIPLSCNNFAPRPASKQ